MLLVWQSLLKIEIKSPIAGRAASQIVLQTLGKFDVKTSSWVQAPPAIRKLGGAIFCDRRFNRVFTYHNGAESYYAARGFRGILKV